MFGYMVITYAHTWRLPHVLSCHLLDLQCQTRPPQQLYMTTQTKETLQTLRQTHSQCIFRTDEMCICSLSLCRKSPNIKLVMSQEPGHIYELRLGRLPSQRSCYCSWRFHELHITMFKQERAAMTAWWVTTKNREI